MKASLTIYWFTSSALSYDTPLQTRNFSILKQPYNLGGGDLQDKSELFDGSQVNSIVTPIYKNREKRIFEFGDRFDPPHWPSKFENHHVRVKIQNCRRPIEWPIKTCARRALSFWERFQLNRTNQLGEKSKKPPEMMLFWKTVFSGGFLDFSLNW